MRHIADVMTRDVRTVTTSEVVGPVRDLMLDGNIHAVPVLDLTGAVAGIITSSDLVEEHPPQLGVTSVMTSDVQTVGPDETLVAAARTMLDAHIHHLVVMGDGAEVRGIVSSFDLLKELAGEVEKHESATLPGRHHAKAGDTIVIRGHEVGRKERKGVIAEVRGEDGGPPYIVHWLDDPHEEPHDVFFFPGSDSDIVPREGEG
jgi:CBS domain containing-hemolysin-like protein